MLLAYSVPSLIRLALLHWRIRPSDLDPVQNMKISFDDIVDFAYLNLESVLNLVLSALFITIFAERVLAGEECEVDHVRGEKNATAIACIFLFLNLLVSGKPYKGVGYLVLTIYRFLVKDIFNFVIMYSIFFVAFLLALQTMHNADHVYLYWMEYTTTIFPQIQAVTRGKAYLNNANIPASANQLLQTDMAVDGCQSHMLAIYSTAFSLLEISFGDGLADGLSAARGTDYECAGFRESGLVAMIPVFWVPQHAHCDDGHDHGPSGRRSARARPAAVRCVRAAAARFACALVPWPSIKRIGSRELATASRAAGPHI